MSSPEQLSLGVVLNAGATFEGFFCGADPVYGSVVHLLKSLHLPDGEPCAYLWGERGSGRSHLLQAACHHFIGLGFSAQYLPLGELAECPPDELLADLEQQRLVCLDDIDLVIADWKWQEALFHLFNRSRALGHHLIFSARMAPRQLVLALEDLRTRLEWGVVFHLPHWSDGEKIDFLQWFSRGRGLELEREVAEFILRRAPRGLAELQELLVTLDHASLARQRRLTIPFVKETLHW